MDSSPPPGLGLGGLMLPDAVGGRRRGFARGNPVAHLKLAWTDNIPWANVVDLRRPGKDIMEKLANAQAQLAAKGGGVVYFPPGEYRFNDPSTCWTASCCAARILAGQQGPRREIRAAQPDRVSEVRVQAPKETAHRSTPPSREFTSKIPPPPPTAGW